MEAFCRAVNLAVRAPRYHAKGSTGLLEPQDLNATQGLPRAPANQPTLARFSPPHHHFHIDPFMFQTWRKAFNLQPYLHAIQGLFPFFVLFYCCKIFPTINFGLTTSKLKTGPGENHNFMLSRKIILSQCHFSFVIS